MKYTWNPDGILVQRNYHFKGQNWREKVTVTSSLSLKVKLINLCRANQPTGFYMMGTLVVKGLKVLFWCNFFHFNSKPTFGLFLNLKQCCLWKNTKSGVSIPDLPGKNLLCFVTVFSVFLTGPGKIVISSNRTSMELLLKDRRFLMFLEGIERNYCPKTDWYVQS